MNADPPIYIVDSYALLAYLGGERGGEKVKQILFETSGGRAHALMSLINLGEVLYITERERGLAKAQEVLAVVEQLPIEILPVDSQAVFAAAHVKVQYPLAYADAFAIAAAQAHGGVLVTGDPEFEAVLDITQIEWIGRE